MVCCYFVIVHFVTFLLNSQLDWRYIFPNILHLFANWTPSGNFFLFFSRFCVFCVWVNRFVRIALDLVLDLDLDYTFGFVPYFVNGLLFVHYDEWLNEFMPGDSIEMKLQWWMTLLWQYVRCVPRRKQNKFLQIYLHLELMVGYVNIEGANLIFQYKKIRRIAKQLQISINIVDKFNFNLCNEFQC